MALEATFDDLETLVEDIAKSSAIRVGQVMQSVADKQRARILQRVASGIGVDGTPFAPYSTTGPYYRNGKRYASYAEYKQSTGSGVVNLRDTGAMLGALQISRADSEGFTLAIDGAEEAVAKANQTRRPWLGATQQESAEMQYDLTAGVVNSIGIVTNSSFDPGNNMQAARNLSFNGRGAMPVTMAGFVY